MHKSCVDVHGIAVQVAGWTRCGAGGNFTDERQSGLKENILTECGQFAIIPRLLWIIYALFSKSCI